MSSKTVTIVPRRTQLIAAMWVGLSLLAIAGRRAAAQIGTVSCHDAGSVTTCRIDQPNVTQRSSQYRNVVFRPGDAVVVSAGGCVQTGGVGATWKRYVNPSGPNADHLYHGLINIPGNPPGGALVRVQTVVGKRLIVPASSPAASNFLTLGYEDDDYGGNGYSSHDDGTGDQCKQGSGRDGGPAWLSLSITHAVPPAVSSPFDVVGTDYDVNGALLNPRWYWETGNPGHPSSDALCGGLTYVTAATADAQPTISIGNPQCTKQLWSVDAPNPLTLNDVLCAYDATDGKLHGHMNWFPATLMGRVVWEDHTDWTHKGDDDYNFSLFPASGGLLTSTHPDHIEVEFDSDETIDAFGSSWWNSFHSAVDQGGSGADSPGGRMVSNKGAVVTGLIGLDSEHGAYSELHPTYAMAIHTDSSVTDDQWAFFARNWGDEGFCSQDQHYWDVSPLTLFIPGPPNATDFTLTQQDVKSNNNVRIDASFVQGGVLLSFYLGTPDSRALVDGAVHIQWTVASGPRAVSGARAGVVASTMAQRFPATFGAPIAAARMTVAQGQPKSEPEAFVFATGLSASQAAQLEQKLKKVPPKKNAVAITMNRVVSSAVARRARVTRVRVVRDVAKVQRDQARGQAVCAAHGGSLPGVPKACK
jgi:hypothetical protein